MKKIIYLSAALLACTSTELMAARQASSSSVMDHLNCPMDLPKHALESFKNGKKDGTTVKQFKVCVQKAESASKAEASRYTNFKEGARQILELHKDFREHVSK